MGPPAFTAELVLVQGRCVHGCRHHLHSPPCCKCVAQTTWEWETMPSDLGEASPNSREAALQALAAAQARCGPDSIHLAPVHPLMHVCAGAWWASLLSAAAALCSPPLISRLLLPWVWARQPQPQGRCVQRTLLCQASTTATQATAAPGEQQAETATWLLHADPGQQAQH